MLKITGNKGFMMTFENGWTVSVQFGTGNYCSKQSYTAEYNSEKDSYIWESTDAEIAAWDSKGVWLTFCWTTWVASTAY